MRIILCDVLILPFADKPIFPMSYSMKRNPNFNYGANSNHGGSYSFGNYMTTGVCDTTVVRHSYHFALKLFKAAVRRIITCFKTERKNTRNAARHEFLNKLVITL